MQATSPTDRVNTWLKSFGEALKAHDTGAVETLFAEECYWRDLVAFTWNLKTMEGRAAICEMAARTLDHVNPRDWRIEGEATETDGVTEAWIAFETDAVHGKGHVRLNENGCWTLLTTAQALKGHEEKKGVTRDIGVAHGAFTNRETWAEKRARERAELGFATQPYVVIIGGGQGGIALGARLKRLGVPAIILEKNERAGDSWRRRYKSLCLHDPVWYDHLPYIPFPDHWPVFSPKDKLGDWLESYVKVMELNYWTKTTCQSATHDAGEQAWTVTVDRDGQTVQLKPKQLVIATGMSGVANVPDIPGADGFKGDIWHSSRHPGGEAYAGKNAVVIGSNNSAHDICGDLWESGANVTMVQRSTTHISRSDTLMDLALGALYSEKALANGITTDIADLIFASIPYKVLPAIHKPLCDEMKSRDAEFYRRLEQAGFMLDFGSDETGLFLKYLRRGSGYYIDVGASELVANGRSSSRPGRSSASPTPRWSWRMAPGLRPIWSCSPPATAR